MAGWREVLGVCCVAVLTVAGASPSTGAPAPVAAAPAGSVPAAGSQAGIAGDPSASAQTVLLPTGDRVIVDAPSGSAPAIGLPDPASLGDAWTIRAGGRVYVFPEAVRGLVGRQLDPELFEVTSLARGDGRQAVSVTYTHRDAPTPVAGVQITSRSGRTATGVVTPESASALGAALRTRDARTALANISRISVRAAPGAQAAWPMHTVTVRGIDHTGAAQLSFAFVMAVDNPAKYAGFVELTRGLGKISVPTGRYLVMAFDGTSDGTTLIAHREFAVTGAGTQVIDARTATTPVTATITTPTSVQVGVTQDVRRVEVTGFASEVSFGALDLGRQPLVRVTPSRAGESATRRLTNTTLAFAPQGQQAGRYALDTSRPGPVSSTPVRVVHDAATFARIDSVFHGPAMTTSMLLRASQKRGAGGWSFGSPLRTPGRVTEFVSTGTDYETTADFWTSRTPSQELGQIESEWRPVPRPVRFTEEWAKNPAHTEIFTDPKVFAPDPVTCFACLDADGSLDLFALQHDSYPWHIMYADPGTVRWSIRTDGDEVASGEDYLAAEGLPLPGDAKVLSARVEMRRGAPYRTSTGVITDLRVPLAASRPLPAGWQCLRGGTCATLPVLYAAYGLPVNLSGALASGRRTLDLRLHQVGVASPSVTSLRVAAAYGAGWVPAPVTDLGGGRYAVTLTVPRAGAGRLSGDLRVQARTSDGAALTETITAAFLLAP